MLVFYKSKTKEMKSESADSDKMTIDKNFIKFKSVNIALYYGDQWSLTIIRLRNMCTTH